MKKLLIFTFLVLIASISKAQITYKIPYQHIQYSYFHSGLLAVNSSGILYTSPIISQFNPIAGSGITLSGSYPNITFTASGSVAFNPIAGANMVLTGSYPNITFTPTVVNLIPGTNITITGSYPNLTVNASTSANSFVGVLSGGTGNGSTDDTAAINASLAAATSGVVYLKQGSTYLVSGTLTVPAGVTFNLNGSSIHSNVNTASIINLSGLKSQVVNGTLYGNFNITSSFTPATGLSGVIINADSCTVKNVYVHNVQAYGIEAPNVNVPTIDNNRVVNTGYIAIFSIAGTLSLNGGSITNNIIDRSAISNANIHEGALKVHGNVGSSYTNNKWNISGNYVYLPSAPSDASTICIEVFGGSSNTNVYGNHTVGGNIGASVVASNNCNIAQNIINTSNEIGIENGSNNNTITGNTINGGSTNGGIVLDGSAANNSIGSNTITGTTGYCIYDSQTSNYNSFSNNSLTPISGQYAFYDSGGAYLSLTGNGFYGAGTASRAIVLDSTPAACNGINITGNNMYNFTTNGILIYCTSNTVTDHIVITGNAIVSCGTPYGTSLSGGATIGSNLVNTNNVN